MTRTSLSVLALLGVFALVPTSSTIAQAPVENEHNTVRLNADRDLSAKQAGLSRTSLVEHTRYADVAAVGATSALTQSRVRRGQTLMIVGGAAFLAGLIIGDDAGTAIAVAGAGIGIYGLYLWAQ
jgi:hypothetical protein